MPHRHFNCISENAAENCICCCCNFWLTKYHTNSMDQVQTALYHGAVWCGSILFAIESFRIKQQTTTQPWKAGTWSYNECKLWKDPHKNWNIPTLLWLTRYIWEWALKYLQISQKSLAYTLRVIILMTPTFLFLCIDDLCHDLLLSPLQQTKKNCDIFPNFQQK